MVFRIFKHHLKISHREVSISDVRLDKKFGDDEKNPVVEAYAYNMHNTAAFSSSIAQTECLMAMLV